MTGTSKFHHRTAHEA